MPLGAGQTEDMESPALEVVKTIVGSSSALSERLH